jgi:hypothetical protein
VDLDGHTYDPLDLGYSFSTCFPLPSLSLSQSSYSWLSSMVALSRLEAYASCSSSCRSILAHCSSIWSWRASCCIVNQRTLYQQVRAGLMSSSSQFCTVMLLKPHGDYFGDLGLLFWPGFFRSTRAPNPSSLAFRSSS